MSIDTVSPAKGSPAPPVARSGAVEHASDLRELLRAMEAMRAGDFSMRLTRESEGSLGRICILFNEIVAANQNMAQQLERIGKAVELIERIAGRRPLGWHTRGPVSLNTRRLVIEEGGFLYDNDTSEDDLPFLIDLGTREHVVLPYASDTNDMQLQLAAGFRLGRHLAEYVIDAFDCLYEEGRTTPKMMTVGLHTRIIGRPGRIAALEAILRHMRAKPSVWFATREQIARHWLASFGRYQ